jgi:hypothetical protein
LITRPALALVVAVQGWPALAAAQAVPPPAPQNPSPMVEHSRAHERIEPRKLPGTRRSFAGPLGKPVDVFVPEGTRHAPTLRLVVHFHGSAFIPEDAVSRLGNGHLLAVVNLGQGSGVYDRAFNDPSAYDTLLNEIRREASDVLGGAMAFDHVTLAGFSAGHGAIRAILRAPQHFAKVDAVLLLDGLHTSYAPDRTVLAEGGKLDERPLEVFVRFGEAAIRGEKRLLITHSEIFPGTFASTTETSDFLVQALGLRRTPVLRWGPRGMQQLSEVRQGQLAVLGFAGNSAPDHIDQFHGMPEFLEMLQKL